MNFSLTLIIKKLKQKKTYTVISLLGIVILYSAYKVFEDHPRIWSSYRGNSETNAYSPLTQINAKNVQNLEVAWQYGPGALPAGTAAPAGGGRFGGGGSQSNPIVVDGVMFNILNRKVYAINSTTGEQVWEFDPSTNALTGGLTLRGVSYWEKGNDKRIMTSVGSNLIAINAKTGELIKTFGVDGKVDMRVDLIPGADIKTVQVSSSSPGAIYGDLIIMGSKVDENYGAAPGHIRAYNVITGKLTWTFHTIPHPGEYGYETWPKDAWKEFGGANDWAGLSVDQKRGMVFIATGGTSYDFYGVDRPGSNLFANSVVALDARTGKRKWHFQTVHHDLWDWDLPSPPNLVTITKNGKKIDAVVQLTKSGFTFVLDRVTGKSLFPIVEKKVPRSDIPGEQAWPTQPIPTLPKPFARQAITEDEIANYSQAAHDSSVRMFRKLRYEGIFTPPSVKGTYHSPGSNGGSDWGGGSFDPRTNILYVKSNDNPEIIRMQKIENRAVTNQTDFEIGRTIYTNNCVGCHGVSKGGDELNYPSLINIQKRLTDEQIIAKIKTGGGKMPGYASVIAGKEAAILAYVTGNDTKTYVTSQSGNAGPAPVQKVRYTNVVAYQALRQPDRKPFLKPPYGTLNAINLATGQYVFRVTAGNDPSLQTPGGPETGATGNSGAISTAGGIVFWGGGADRKFKAYDSKTGKTIWETTLPGAQNSTPSTYMGADGNQYIAITIGADATHPNGSVITYRLKK
jgi:quinoprotein glucose dehydrogenase